MSFTDKCEKFGSFEMSMNDRRWNWCEKARYSSVSIVTRLRAERSGVRIPSVTTFSVLHVIRKGSGTYPRSCYTVRGFFHVAKRPGRDVHYWVPVSNTEVKNGWSYTSSPLTCFHGVNIEKIYFYTE